MQQKKPISPDAARLRMADLCARSEQCEFDIRKKLQRLGQSADTTDSIISFLIENRFLDSRRFAVSFARDKCRFSSWGNNKIRLGLMMKRIPKADIEAALQEIDRADYRDALKRVTLAKARNLDLTGSDAREDRLKLYRHILSRGFESSLASKAVESIIRSSRREQERKNSEE